MINGSPVNSAYIDAHPWVGVDIKQAVGRGEDAPIGRQSTPTIPIDYGVHREKGRVVVYKISVVPGRAVDPASAYPWRFQVKHIIGYAQEGEGAEALRASIGVAVGRGIDVEIARRLYDKWVGVGQAREVSEVRAVGRVAGVAVGRATEAEAARALGYALGVRVHRAETTGAAQGAFYGRKTAYSPAIEYSDAFPITAFFPDWRPASPQDDSFWTEDSEESSSPWTEASEA